VRTRDEHDAHLWYGAVDRARVCARPGRSAPARPYRRAAVLVAHWRACAPGALRPAVRTGERGPGTADAHGGAGRVAGLARHRVVRCERVPRGARRAPDEGTPRRANFSLTSFVVPYNAVPGDSPWSRDLDRCLPRHHAAGATLRGQFSG